MPYASRLLRLVGQFLDALVGAGPLVVAALAIPGFAVAGSEIGGAILFLGALGWMLFYYFFADGLGEGQSFGKRWLGIRVIGIDSGQPCTFGQSFVRNLLLAILGPIDWIFIFGNRHQRLGDILARTVVVVAE